MSYLKPQTPLQHKDGDYFYPLTTIDQVIMEDGITRLSGADLVSISTDGAPEGEVVGINADTLGGYAADAYVKKTDAMVVTKNYSVVGGMDEPTIPTENMIWVQTENVVGKVHFSSVEPSSVNDNDIWIYTGDGSSVAFDAIKIGNDTMNTVYPVSAKQYVSGAWVDKTAKSYQNGEWVDWYIYLLNGADLCEKITGGWTGHALAFNSDNTGRGVIPILTTDENSITLNLSMAEWRSGIFAANKKFNLDNVNEILITGFSSSNFSVSGHAGLTVYSEIGQYVESNVVARVTLNKEHKTYSLNVANVKGEHVIALSLLSNGSTKASITIEEIRLAQKGGKA